MIHVLGIASAARSVLVSWMPRVLTALMQFLLLYTLVLDGAAHAQGPTNAPGPVCYPDDRPVTLTGTLVERRGSILVIRNNSRGESLGTRPAAVRYFALRFDAPICLTLRSLDDDPPYREEAIEIRVSLTNVDEQSIRRSLNRRVRVTGRLFENPSPHLPTPLSLDDAVIER